MALAAFVALLPAAAFGQAGTLYDLDSNLAGASAPVAISTAATTSLVANGGGLNPGGGKTSVNITEYEIVASGTGTIKFVAGTTVTTPCDTNQVNLSGAFSLVAQGRIQAGNGFGPVLIAPAGDDVCAVTSAAVGMNGALAYRIK